MRRLTPSWSTSGYAIVGGDGLPMTFTYRKTAEEAVAALGLLGQAEHWERLQKEEGWKVLPAVGTVYCIDEDGDPP